jgi:hypothetical protein
MIIKEGYKFVDGKGYDYRCVKLYNKLVILSPHTQYLLEKAILLTRDFEIKCIISSFKKAALGNGFLMMSTCLNEFCTSEHELII